MTSPRRELILVGCRVRAGLSEGAAIQPVVGVQLIGKRSQTGPEETADYVLQPEAARKLAEDLIRAADRAEQMGGRSADTSHN